MFSDENKSSSLAKQLAGFDSVILDTCSLMEDSFPEWLDAYTGAKDYLDPEFKIAVPEAAIAELKKHSRDRKNVDKRIPAIRALKIFKEAKRLKLLCVGKKNHNRNFADNAIYAQVSEDRLIQKILVITQDKKLATDLKNLNNLNSQKGRRVSVFKVVPGGKLAENNGEDYFNYQRTHERNDKRFFEKEGRFARKTPQNSPLNKVSSNSLKDPAIAEVLANDQKLNANLKNPNYPIESKTADIQKQLEAIIALPPEKKAGLALLQGESKLKQSLQMLKVSKPSAPKEPSPAPAASVVENKGPAPVRPLDPSIKPLVVSKEEPTVLVKTPAKKLWFGEGKTLGYALDMVAEHYGLMFRDPSIGYVSFVHGPIDLTENDREKILALIQEGLAKEPKFEGMYASFKVLAEKKEKGFKVYIDLHPVSSVQMETAIKAGALAQGEKKIEKKPEVSPVAELDQETQVVPAPGETKKPVAIQKEKAAPKKAKKAEKSPAVLAVPNTNAAVPEGVTLVVGIPTDQRKRDWIERTARRDALGAKTDGKKEPKKSTSHKKEPVKAKKDAPKPAAKAAAKKPSAQPSKTPARKEKLASPTKETPKKKAKQKEASTPVVAKPSPKPAPKKADVQSKKKKADSKKAVQSPLETALASEKKLKSNFHNPNYPSVNKKKDIEEQIKTVRKLSPEDRSKLSFGLDALKAMSSLL